MRGNIGNVLQQHAQITTDTIVADCAYMKQEFDRISLQHKQCRYALIGCFCLLPAIALVTIFSDDVGVYKCAIVSMLVILACIIVLLFEVYLRWYRIQTISDTLGVITRNSMIATLHLLAHHQTMVHLDAIHQQLSPNGHAVRYTVDISDNFMAASIDHPIYDL